jgi:pyruvate/2-oxoglutarate dehydrogenase complex dihydrolipoamide dehydrogenase (E3) component
LAQAVGLELAQAFGRFGAEVTVVEAADHALPMEEPENAAALDEALRRDGITLITGTTAIAAASSERGITVELADGTHLEGERLLVATGRRPDLGSLGVADLGMDPDAKSIPTDENLRAGDGVRAVWDVTGHGEFTHVAYYHAQIAATDILGTEHEPADYTAVPQVTFTDPEVASVGLTEAAARAQGLDVRVGLLPTSSSDRGWLHGPRADLGMTKVVADAAAGVLVGGRNGPGERRGGGIPGTGHPRPDPGGPPDGSHLPVPDVHARRPRRAPPAGLIDVSPPACGRGPAGRPRRVSPVTAAGSAGRSWSRGPRPSCG